MGDYQIVANTNPSDEEVAFKKSDAYLKDEKGNPIPGRSPKDHHNFLSIEFSNESVNNTLLGDWFIGDKPRAGNNKVHFSFNRNGEIEYIQVITKNADGTETPGEYIPAVMSDDVKNYIKTVKLHERDFGPMTLGGRIKGNTFNRLDQIVVASLDAHEKKKNRSDAVTPVQAQLDAERKVSAARETAVRDVEALDGLSLEEKKKAMADVVAKIKTSNASPADKAAAEDALNRNKDKTDKLSNADMTQVFTLLRKTDEGDIRAKKSVETALEDHKNNERAAFEKSLDALNGLSDTQKTELTRQALTKLAEKSPDAKVKKDSAERATEIAGLSITKIDREMKKALVDLWTVSGGDSNTLVSEAKKGALSSTVAPAAPAVAPGAPVVPAAPDATATARKELEDQLKEYQKATGMSDENVQKHLKRIEDTLKSYAAYNPENLKTETAAWKKATDLADAYWTAFKESAENKGLNANSEWNKQLAIPDSDVVKIARGELTMDEIKDKTVALTTPAAPVAGPALPPPLPPVEPAAVGMAEVTAELRAAIEAKLKLEAKVNGKTFDPNEVDKTLTKEIAKVDADIKEATDKGMTLPESYKADFLKDTVTARYQRETKELEDKAKTTVAATTKTEGKKHRRGEHRHDPRAGAETPSTSKAEVKPVTPPVVPVVEEKKAPVVSLTGIRDGMQIFTVDGKEYTAKITEDTDAMKGNVFKITEITPAGGKPITGLNITSGEGFTSRNKERVLKETLLQAANNEAVAKPIMEANINKSREAASKLLTGLASWIKPANTAAVAPTPVVPPIAPAQPEPPKPLVAAEKLSIGAALLRSADYGKDDDRGSVTYSGSDGVIGSGELTYMFSNAAADGIMWGDAGVRARNAANRATLMAIVADDSDPKKVDRKKLDAVVDASGIKVNVDHLEKILNTEPATSGGSTTGYGSIPYCPPGGVIYTGR